MQIDQHSGQVQRFN